MPVFLTLILVIVVCHWLGRAAVADPIEQDMAPADRSGIIQKSDAALILNISLRKLRALAADLAEQRDFTQALRLWVRALEITEQAVGPDHLQTADTLGNLALTYLRLGQYAKALPLQERTLVIYEQILGPDHPDKAQALGNLAGIYVGLGQYAQALPLQEQALVIYEQALGPDHPDTALALGNLAGTYSDLGQYTKALPLEERALAIYEQALGPDHPDTALALGNLAATYSDLGQYTKALPLEERALAIYERALGPDHPDTALGLGNLAGTYSDLGQYTKALPLEERALAIYEQAWGPDHPDTARALGNLAATYSDLGQYAKALPLQERALAIYEQIFGPDHPDTALALGNLSQTHFHQGQYERALPLQERALAIYEQALGPDHPDTARARGDLAVSYSATGQYEEALPLEERALAIYEQAFGPDHPDTARAIGNLAQTYFSAGWYAQAIPLQERTMLIREQILGPDHPYTALAISNLALSYSEIGQQEVALALKERALAVYEHALGLDHPDTALALGNLAGTYSDLGQYAQALLLQKRALAVYEHALGPDHPHTALALGNLAGTYSDLGQYAQALPLQERALAVYEHALGPNHPDTARALSNLAGIYFREGRYGQALPLEERALAIYEQVLGPNHPDTSLNRAHYAKLMYRVELPLLAVMFLKMAVNSQQLLRQNVRQLGSVALESYTKKVESVYQTLADTLLELDRLAEAQAVLDLLKQDEQFEFVRRNHADSKGRTVIPLTALEEEWTAGYNQVARTLFSLSVEHQVLAKIPADQLTKAQQSRRKELAVYKAVATKEFEAFLTDLRTKIREEDRVGSVDNKAVIPVAAKELQLLLAGLGPDVALARYFITDKHVGVLVSTAGTEKAYRSDIEAKSLSRKIFEFTAALKSPTVDPIPFAQELYAILFEPMAQELRGAGIKTVMISPDGPLRYLPYGALHNGKRYLIQDFELPMFTSVTRDRLREPPVSDWTAAGLGVTRAYRDYVPLPSVRMEIEGIVKVGRSGMIPGEVYLDDAFTSERLRDVADRGFHAMHIASHFRFSPGTELNSYLLLGDGAQLTLADLRAGNFNFQDVDLLTLSACDTGLGGGRDANGREIEGFGVIAQQQGAKAVLATLWKVADQSTAKLMVATYRHLVERGATKIGALQAAQRELLADPKYAHPYYWAPFLLMGNWR